MPSKVCIDRTQKFLRLYGMQIARAIADTPLFYAGVIGQKCNESGYGTSPMAVKYNNFCGITGKPQEAYGSYKSGGYTWAKFATPYDCFRCYARVTTSLARYNKAMLATSPEEQIKALVDAGYCALTEKMPSSTYYVKVCQGAIDVTRQVCPTAKVTSENLNAILATLQTNLL